MERWIGRVAVVTGASSGIGESVAKELTKQGMKVAALARRVDRLQALEEECSNFEGSLKSYKCDVTNEDEIVSVIKEIVDDLGPISALVNNAGMATPHALTDTSMGSGREIFDTNVIGVIIMTQNVIEQMKSNNIDDGHIININSMAGHTVLPIKFMSNYCASKNAVTILTESLKNELASLKSKIRVTSISPGIVKTALSEAALGHLPLPFLLPQDVADAIVYALSARPDINISELTIQPVGETMMSFCD
ncbi:hypothetical protein O3M35_007105 [Rhynocoris fuscipes]|uniref:Dehydrogenase n=1 Tax=Rhynocoris fuscipes TaxID=488301 RepID=A0AAW1D9S0_9HEMI